MATDAGRVVLLVEPQDDSREMYVEFLRHHGFAARCFCRSRVCRTNYSVNCVN